MMVLRFCNMAKEVLSLLSLLTNHDESPPMHPIITFELQCAFCFAIITSITCFLLIIHHGATSVSVSHICWAWVTVVWVKIESEWKMSESVSYSTTSRLLYLVECKWHLDIISSHRPGLFPYWQCRCYMYFSNSVSSWQTTKPYLWYFVSLLSWSY